MGTVISIILFSIAGILAFYALLFVILTRVGRFIAHQQERAYVELVLHNVETHSAIEMQEREWYA